MGIAQRRKGKRGEQEAVNLILPAFPLARSKRAGGESATVDRGRDILGTPGYCIQVHRGRSTPCERKLEEAVTAAEGTYDIPVALVRRDRGPWTATIRASDFLALVYQLEKLRNEYAKCVQDRATGISLD
jgi:hypothetical protein